MLLSLNTKSENSYIKERKMLFWNIKNNSFDNYEMLMKRGSHYK